MLGIGRASARRRLVPGVWLRWWWWGGEVSRLGALAGSRRALDRRAEVENLLRRWLGSRRPLDRVR